MTKTQFDATPQAMMLDVRNVAKMLQCSDRHVANLSKEGRIPPPVRLGTLVRWPRKTIEDWIAAGCPPISCADSQRSNQSDSDDREAA